MPIYVYECQKCEKTFEVEQRIIEDALKDCTLCDAKGSLKRIIQPMVVVFKGSGFYVNDSANSSKAADAKPASKESEPTPADHPAPTPPAATTKEP